MKTISIIGYGGFGRLAGQTLAGHFTVGAHDGHASASDMAADGVAPLSFEDASQCDVVIIAVPIQSMEEVIIRLAPLVRPGTTVVDVGSVKMLPSRWLNEHFAADVHVVPTHPLFGPQSAARDGLTGRQLVICPVRGDQHLKVAAMGETLGLRVRITTAEEHDREMAYVQALTHLIGRSLSAMDIPDERLKTQSYQHLLDLCGLIGGDSFELFAAIQTLNPFADPVAREFVAHAESLLKQVHTT